MVSSIFRPQQIFFKWYGKFFKSILLKFTQIFVQDKTSLRLLQEAHINNASISGDTRFDRVIEIAEKFQPLPLIEKFCGNDKVLVAGSTWEEDEEELVHYVKSHPEIKFIFAPHEIDAENLKDVKKEFPGSIFYSELSISFEPSALSNEQGNLKHQTSNIKHQTSNILIIDNIGMLSKLYRYADIAFIGGGFGDDGIHNVLEAAVYGKPVLHGPEYEKFAEAAELVELGASVPVSNALELEKILDALWADKTMLKTKGAIARNYVYSKAGASKKIMDYIQENRLLTS
jgi:3-deoxy-D-manno-octulosonic-acid transferase